MPDPIRVVVELNTTGQLSIRQAEQSLDSFSRRLAHLSAQGAPSSRMMRQLTADINGANAAFHSLATRGMNRVNMEMNRMSEGLLTLGRRGFYVFVGGVAAAGYALNRLGREFVKVNEQFAGLEITLKSSFRSLEIARKLREEIQLITVRSPIPFEHLAAYTRSLSVIPYTRSELAAQSARGTLRDPEGFFQRAVKLAEQMLTFRPDKTEEDVEFSLREALSGQFRSLIRRFDIPSTVLTTISGKTLQELSTDPRETFEAMKKFFDKIITPQSIAELARQPKVLFQNLWEQILQIPLLKIGDTGLYQEFLNIFVALFEQASAFISSGSADRLFKSAGTAFSSILKTAMGTAGRGTEFLLGKAGFGQNQLPGLPLVERVASAIVAGINKLSETLPVLIDKLLKFFKEIGPALVSFIKVLGNIATFVFNNPLTSFLVYFFRDAIFRGVTEGLKWALVKSLGNITTAFAQGIAAAYAPGPAGFVSKAALANPLTAAAYGATTGALTGGPSAPLLIPAGGGRWRVPSSAAGAQLAALGVTAASGVPYAGGAIVSVAAGANYNAGVVMAQAQQNALARAASAAAGASFLSRMGAGTMGVARAGGAWLMGLGPQVAAIVGIMLLFQGAVTLFEKAVNHFNEKVRKAADQQAQDALLISGSRATVQQKSFGERAQALLNMEEMLDNRRVLLEAENKARARRGEPPLDVSPRVANQGLRFPVGMTGGIFSLDAPEGSAIAHLQKLLKDEASAKAFLENKSDEFVSEVARVSFQRSKSVREAARQVTTVSNLLPSLTDDIGVLLEAILKAQNNLVLPPELADRLSLSRFTDANARKFTEMQAASAKFLDDTTMFSEYFKDSLAKIGEQLSSVQNADILSFEEDFAKFLEARRMAANPAFLMQKSFRQMDETFERNQQAASAISRIAGLKGTPEERAVRLKEFGYDYDLFLSAFDKQIEAAESFVKLAPRNKAAADHLKSLVERRAEFQKNPESFLLNKANEAFERIDVDSRDLVIRKMQFYASFLHESFGAARPGLMKGVSDPDWNKQLADMTSVLFENMSRYYEGFTEGAANEIGKLFAESVPDGAAMVRDSVAEQLRSQGKFSEAFGQLAGRLADATTDALRAWQKELSFAVFNAADAKAYAQAEGRLNKAAVRHSNIKALWELFTGFTVESGRIEKGVRTTEDERIKIFDRNRGRADLLAFFNNVGQFTAQGGGVSSMMLEFARKGRFAGGLSAPTDYMSLGRLTRDVTPDDMLRDRLALYREMEPLLKKTIEHYKEQADLEARNTAEGRSRIQQLEQQALALEQLIEKNRQYQLEVVGRGPLRSLKEGFFGVTERFSLEAQNFKQVGQDIANSLQQNLGNAFTGFITGAEKAGQAARNFALNVLNSMVQILSNKLAAQLLGGIFAFASPSLGLTGTGPPLTTEMSNAPGVFTSNIELTSSLYASGGRLQGGSGQRDDVPFLGMAGEFVIRKAAVQKYGESLFEAFNAGRVPMFVGGGAVSPSPSFGGSGNQYNFEINVTANGSSTASGQGPEDARERGAEMAREIKALVQNYVDDMTRTGGRLSRSGAR